MAPPPGSLPWSPLPPARLGLLLVCLSLQHRARAGSCELQKLPLTSRPSTGLGMPCCSLNLVARAGEEGEPCRVIIGTLRTRLGPSRAEGVARAAGTLQLDTKPGLVVPSLALCPRGRLCHRNPGMEARCAWPGPRGDLGRRPRAQLPLVGHMSKGSGHPTAHGQWLPAALPHPCLRLCGPVWKTSPCPPGDRLAVGTVHRTVSPGPSHQLRML